MKHFKRNPEGKKKSPTEQTEETQPGASQLKETREHELESHKIQQDEELRLSKASTKPVSGRPTTIDASHRFGKNKGST